MILKIQKKIEKYNAIQYNGKNILDVAEHLHLKGYHYKITKLIDAVVITNNNRSNFIFNEDILVLNIENQLHTYNLYKNDWILVGNNEVKIISDVVFKVDYELSNTKA